MQRDDRVPLLDMLQSAQVIKTFVQTMTCDAFEQNELLIWGVVKLIENIREASRRVSNTGQDAHPEIPWSQIGGMSERLYSHKQVDTEITGSVIHTDIPHWIDLIAPLVPPDAELMSHPIVTRITNPNIEIPYEQIAAICERWHITELALFGSVLRDDFRPDSDIDFLIRFGPQFEHDIENYEAIENEFKVLLGHRIDLVVRKYVEQNSNYLLRRYILNSAQTIYAAGS